ncbi:MAG: hypothetical protein K5839_04290, partial [Treponemataceae bacterium]|nr:hypothetical protein [Treponemataceae bacterium]
MMMSLREAGSSSGGTSGGSSSGSTTTSFNIVYKANTDYQVSGQTQADVTQTLTCGVSGTIITNPFENIAGKFFDGWSTSSTGDAVYTEGQSFIRQEDSSETLYLYAVWADGYYVSGTDSVLTSGSDTDGDGSERAPFASINRALTQIGEENLSDRAWTILISGTFTENLSISDDNLTGQSLTIRGVTGSSADIIQPSSEGTVVTIATSTPILMEKLCITGGTGSGETGEGKWKYAGGGIYMGPYTEESSGANLTLGQDSLVSGNTAAKCGGGIYLLGNSTLTLDGGSVSGNTVTSVTNEYQGGAGIACYNSNVIINSGSVSNNVLSGTAGGQRAGGAGIYFRNNGSSSDLALTINGGSISGNITNSTGTSRIGGGVLMLGANAALVMNGGSISSNKCGYGGAGIALSNPSTSEPVTFTMNGGSISGNVCDAQNYNSDTSQQTFGGGIWAYQNYTYVLMAGGQIYENHSDTGAAIDVDANYPVFRMTGGTIRNNSSTATLEYNQYKGGAIAVSNKFYLSGTSLIPSGTDDENCIMVNTSKSVTVILESSLSSEFEACILPLSTFSTSTIVLSDVTDGAAYVASEHNKFS